MNEATITFTAENRTTQDYIIKRPTVPRQSDSLALVALYDATNENGWSNNTNWGKTPIEEWHRVTVLMTV